MDKRERPIGFMDSGMGGISVLREALRLMPQEDYLYYGDSAHTPYGPRSTEEIRRLTENCVRFLLERGVKAVVLACNTATSAAAAPLREKYPDIPIIGIEPALKPAVLRWPGGNILVTGTELTLREEKFRGQMRRYEGSAHVYVQPLGDIPGYVESGRTECPELKRYLHERLEPWAALGLDAVVLGCTHFPFVEEQIRSAVGGHAELFDGAAGTVRETRRRLRESGLLREREERGTVRIFQSGTDAEWIARARRLLESPLG